MTQSRLSIASPTDTDFFTAVPSPADKTAQPSSSEATNTCCSLYAHGTDNGTVSIYNGERANEKRNRDFHALFRSVPEDDPLIEDFGCALQKEILLQGRIYISENYLCFNANIFGWVTNLVIAFTDIVEIEKKTTAIFIPNAIQVSTSHSKHFFASFLSRDQAFDLIESVWRASRSSMDRCSADKTVVDGRDRDTVPFANQEDFPAGFDSNSGSDVASTLSIETHDDADISEGQSGEKQDFFPQVPMTRLKKYRHDRRPRAISEAGYRPNAVAFEEDDRQTNVPAVTQAKEKTVCACEQSGGHFPNLVADNTYNTTLQSLYSLLYTGDFMTNFLISEKNTDVTIGLWQRNANGNAIYTRDSFYVKPLNSPIGPKATKCILREEILHDDVNEYVTQLTTTQTPDVPSGGSFCVKTRVCLTWAGKGKTRLLVTVLVEFTKYSWLKVAIEKGSVDGQVLFFKNLDQAIRRHISDNSRVSELKRSDKRKKRKQRRDQKSRHLNQHASDWDKPASTVTRLFDGLVNSMMMPSVGQMTVICMLSLVIVNVFIARKLAKVDSHLSTLSNEIKSPRTQDPFVSMQIVDPVSSEEMWEWLGQMDPEHQQAADTKSEPGPEPLEREQRDDKLAHHLLASVMAKDKLDKGMADLERMIQRAGASISQMSATVERQRQRLKDDWSSQ